MIHRRSETDLQTHHVLILIFDILECVGDDLDAHVEEICGSNVKDLLGKLFPILEDLVDRHGAHDGPLVALEREHGDLLDFLGRFVDELLDRGPEHFVVVGRDLDLGDAGD